MQEVCFTNFWTGNALSEAVQGYQKRKKKKKNADLPTLFFCGLKPETNLVCGRIGLYLDTYILTSYARRHQQWSKHERIPRTRTRFEFSVV